MKKTTTFLFMALLGVTCTYGANEQRLPSGYFAPTIYRNQPAPNTYYQPQPTPAAYAPASGNYYQPAPAAYSPVPGNYYQSTPNKCISGDLAIDGIIGLSENRSEAPNLYGGMLSAGLVLVEHHRLSFSIGFLGGSQDQDNSIDGYFIDEDLDYYDFRLNYKASVFSMPFLLGYSYQHKLSKSVQFYVGARTGFMYTDCTLKGTLIISDGYNQYREDDKDSEHSFDPMGGFHVGLQFFVTEHTAINVGYELWKIWMDNPVNESLELPSSSLNPLYHVVRLGVTYNF